MFNFISSLRLHYAIENEEAKRFLPGWGGGKFHCKTEYNSYTTLLLK